MEYFFQDRKYPKVLRGHLKMGGSNPEGDSIGVTSVYFTKNEKPWMPVMGEMHFQRCARERWGECLSKMKAGGITLVSTYLFWIYLEEQEGRMDFTQDNDVRAFVQECQGHGLEVMLRIGPWVHGECRNGGFPDWLVKKPYKLRENNEQYLGQVRRFFTAIAGQVKGMLYEDGGCIVGIQLENEYVHDAGHLAKLKEIAIEAGLKVPLYTVTGWNSVCGARIPLDEVVPLFGGYCDAPWARHIKRLPPSPHYMFIPMRNETAINENMEVYQGRDGEWQLPYERYPFATCEMGGGIQVTHHRRPIISGMDIYAMALVKLGVGNNLPGYYMYCGGTNKLGKLSTLQESKATDYYNDYSILSYDFQGAVSEYGEIREQYRLLNLLHLFVQDFQEILAPMEAVPAAKQLLPDDMESLRCGMRTDGEQGFVFVNHYQRLTKLKDVYGAVIHAQTVTLPPLDICGEISFFLPFGIRMGQKRLVYATAQPVCVQGDTWFFVQVPGIAAEYLFDDGTCVKAGQEGRNGAKKTAAWLPDAAVRTGDIRILTLTMEQAKYIRRLDGQIYLGKGCDLYLEEGSIKAVQDEHCIYAKWNGKDFGEIQDTGKEQEEPEMALEPVDELPFAIKDEYMQQLQLESERQLRFYRLMVKGSRGFISLEQTYDTAQLYADGHLIADNFYYGMPWRVPAKLAAGKECYLVLSEMKNDFYREF